MKGAISWNTNGVIYPLIRLHGKLYTTTEQQNKKEKKIYLVSAHFKDLKHPVSFLKYIGTEKVRFVKERGIFRGVGS